MSRGLLNQWWFLLVWYSLHLSFEWWKIKKNKTIKMPKILQFFYLKRNGFWSLWLFVNNYWTSWLYFQYTKYKLKVLLKVMLSVDNAKNYFPGITRFFSWFLVPWPICLSCVTAFMVAIYILHIYKNYRYLIVSSQIARVQDP